VSIEFDGNSSWSIFKSRNESSAIEGVSRKLRSELEFNPRHHPRYPLNPLSGSPVREPFPAL